MKHSRFSFSNLNELNTFCSDNDLNIPSSQDLSSWVKELTIKEHILPNRIAIQPMEGCDGNADGSPGELTIRRYERFAKGGAGLIWFEAVAVAPEGRANPRQLWLTRENAESFRKLVADIRTNSPVNPIIICQLTHSGRYSRPVDKASPLTACSNEVMDARTGAGQVVTDEYLSELEDKYVEAAKLAISVGFDGIDIKACHRYLISELLCAHNRTGKYGGNYEGRTRFIKNIFAKISTALPESAIISSRMNIYDGIEGGFGVSPTNADEMDLSEPIRLCSELMELGLSLLDITMGTPYFNPHVNRPYDIGEYEPSEHPAQGVARMIEGCAKLKSTLPALTVVATGYSWLRELASFVGAGVIEQGNADIVGFGRQAFAYPDFANDILKGKMERSKCCTACGSCTRLMRLGGTTGCVIKDSAVYAPLLKEAMRNAKS
ncbi:MAG TPA: NADH:flavin oxidoreductase [Oscillospiraceae bacterium]|nr:NADH:flavin oxidoreductase [Oscillospiraceae bacterium]